MEDRQKEYLLHKENDWGNTDECWEEYLNW